MNRKKREHGRTPASPQSAQHHQHARSSRNKRSRFSKIPVHPDAQRLLDWAVKTSKRRVVPFATEFIRAENNDVQSPLSRFVRGDGGGGRGGEVRLKLYLSINLIAARKPFDVRPLPARVWAEMLNLPQPETNGARRISKALTWMQQQGFIHIEDRRSGKPPRLYLLSQEGDRRPYSRPTRNWVNIPVEFWQNHWIAKLSGRATALFLILLDLQGGKSRASGAWERPDVARWRYGISQDTWNRGVRELQEAGIVHVTREKRGERWDWVRVRNIYLVNTDRLMNGP